MAEFAGTAEDVLRTMLESMADRVAGRPFRRADPGFFGTPDAPDLRFTEEADDEGEPGAGGSGWHMAYGLAIDAGFTPEQAKVMAAIAMAESGGNPRAHNPNGRDNSYGLWQINMLGRMGADRRRQFGIGSNEELWNPSVNARAAKAVFDAQGFDAWSVFEDGKYQQYLDGANVSTGTLNTKGSLAWGGHANGRIPKEALEQIGGDHMLEEGAAAEWKRMVADAKRAGVNLSVTDSYRSYEGQVSVRKRKGHLVATAKPGTSNHGWGRALDVNVNDGRTLAWLRANAEKYGFVNPEWARKPGKSYEPWHWEYRRGPTQQVPTGGHDHANVPQALRRPQPLDFPIPSGSTPTDRPMKGAF